MRYIYLGGKHGKGMSVVIDDDDYEKTALQSLIESAKQSILNTSTGRGDMDRCKICRRRYWRDWYYIVGHKSLKITGGLKDKAKVSTGLRLSGRRQTNETVDVLE